MISKLSIVFPILIGLLLCIHRWISSKLHSLPTSEWRSTFRAMLINRMMSSMSSNVRYPLMMTLRVPRLPFVLTFDDDFEDFRDKFRGYHVRAIFPLRFALPPGIRSRSPGPGPRRHGADLIPFPRRRSDSPPRRARSTGMRHPSL